MRHPLDLCATIPCVAMRGASKKNATGARSVEGTALRWARFRHLSLLVGDIGLERLLFYSTRIPFVSGAKDWRSPQPTLAMTANRRYQPLARRGRMAGKSAKRTLLRQLRTTTLSRTSNSCELATIDISSSVYTISLRGSQYLSAHRFVCDAVRNHTIKT